ncbi:MAG: cytochrome c biogenesis protein CcsA [Saprospiraceae bacterium]|nr:cytochrome c biogenesis protein CcsA [Saprospiraceae bacterium]
MHPNQIWWKILGAVLFLIVLNRGLLTPLKHGIVDVKPDRFQAGQEIELDIYAYNSQYNAASELSVFLKPLQKDHHLGKRLMLAASKVEVLSPVQLRAHFKLPEFLPDIVKVSLFSVIVDSPLDGAAVIPAKVIIVQDSIHFENGMLAWSPGNLNEFHQKNKLHFPYRNILVETIRNTFFHVSLWFAMFLLLGMSVYFSFRYLKNPDPEYDLKAFALVRTGIFFGLLGCATGSLWARYTWETWWTTDIKLNMAALSILIYLAYLVLRASVEDIDRKRRIAAAYNIFALVAVIPLIFVLPRLTDSLHPGNGGNPAFGSDDMDNALRLIFYPSVFALMLMGLWLASLLYRLDKIKSHLDESENNF